MREAIRRRLGREVERLHAAIDRGIDDAESNIRDIGIRIAADDPARALSFDDELRVRCRSLADMPERLPISLYRGGRAMRRITCGSYLIFYCLFDGRIAIAPVPHGARDWSTLLSDQQ